MTRIFVSYRRSDAPGHAGRIYDGLIARFAPENVFRDLDTMEPGVDFGEIIEDTVAQCDAMVVVIGPRWLDAEGGGTRRLDNPDDWVRLEVAAALTRRVPVLPILVQGAAMPAPPELPDDVRELARRNALELSESAWSPQFSRLLGRLETIVDADSQAHQTRLERVRARGGDGPARHPPRASPVARSRSPRWAIRAEIIAVLGVGAVIVAVVLWRTGAFDSAPKPKPKASRPTITGSVSWIANTTNRTQFQTLEVGNVPAGSTVTAGCPAGCSRASLVVHDAIGTVPLLSLFGGKAVPPGTLITVVVSHPGFVATVTTLETRRQKAPDVSRKCLLTPAGTPRPCPTPGPASQ
jgi:hypothetical protein